MANDDLTKVNFKIFVADDTASGATADVVFLSVKLDGQARCLWFCIPTEAIMRPADRGTDSGVSGIWGSTHS
jgi:hypothetical protein